MKTFPVGEIRANISAVLKEVMTGEEVGIAFGRARQTIAVIVPIDDYKKMKGRSLGTLEGKLSVEFKDNWKMNDEEFLGS